MSEEQDSTVESAGYMVRKVIHLQPELAERAEAFMGNLRARGSLIRLGELVRLALYEYLENHE